MMPFLLHLPLAAGWRVNDLAQFPAARLALGGAQATLTASNATVVVRPSKALPTPWPDDAAYWTERLIGHERVLVTSPARLTRLNGARVYRVETQSDSDDGGPLYTTLLAFEYRADGATRLAIFTFEDTAREYRAGAPRVRRLFASLRPPRLQDARAPKNLK